MRDAHAAWVLKYVQAWTTNDREAIRSLFSEDARYFRAPQLDPIEGRDAIVAWWLEAQDEPGTWSYQFELLGVDGAVGFVKGRTDYREEHKAYLNLWVIRLNEAGECTEFSVGVALDRRPTAP